MVLDAGRVVEFDTPDNLLRDKRTIFYGMVDEAGLAPKIRTIPETEDLMEHNEPEPEVAKGEDKKESTKKD